MMTGAMPAKFHSRRVSGDWQPFTSTSNRLLGPHSCCAPHFGALVFERAVQHSIGLLLTVDCSLSVSTYHLSIAESFKRRRLKSMRGRALFSYHEIWARVHLAQIK
jgi:hypothetical protein